VIARLVESREIAPSVRHFVFEVPEVKEFHFQPGQFVSFTAILADRPITRAYSIAGPAKGNRFDLCLNLVREGHFSPFLFDLRVSDQIEMTGPIGTFVLGTPSDSVMIATGTGIAPFRPMLHEILPKDPGHSYTLLFGVRYERSLLYRAEFEDFQRRFSNFHFWPTLSRPDRAWKGRTGHVQAHLDEAIGERRDLNVYVCGLRAMVDDVRNILKEKGFERQRIIYEKYD
jgi:CDP-4-dehydro-6-deoxyglucose reductase, E3